jgi:hypothetical protein
MAVFTSSLVSFIYKVFCGFWYVPHLFLGQKAWGSFVFNAIKQPQETQVFVTVLNISQDSQIEYLSCLTFSGTFSILGLRRSQGLAGL